MKQNLQKELDNLPILSDEQFDQVSAILLEEYENAEIDKDCFVITKEDLAEGNLKTKGI